MQGSDTQLVQLHGASQIPSSAGSVSLPFLFSLPNCVSFFPLSSLSILFLESLVIETVYLQHSLASHRCVLLGLEETKVSRLSPGSPRGGLNGPFILSWRCSQFLPRLAVFFMTVVSLCTGTRPVAKRPFIIQESPSMKLI